MLCHNFFFYQTKPKKNNIFIYFAYGKKCFAYFVILRRLHISSILFLKKIKTFLALFLENIALNFTRSL
jgi:hypothetical protein